MLSTLSCWAVMPLAALYNARITLNRSFSTDRKRWAGRRAYPTSSTDSCDFLNRLCIHFSADADGLLQHLELTHDSDQPHSGFGDRHVRILEFSLLDIHALGRDGTILWVWVFEAALAHLPECRGRLEIHDLQLPNALTILTNGAVRLDLDRLAGRHANRLTANAAQRESIGRR